MGWIRTRRGELSYTDTREGQAALLLVHGWGGNSQEWCPTLALLTRPETAAWIAGHLHGTGSAALTWPGHGRYLHEEPHAAALHVFSWLPGATRRALSSRQAMRRPVIAAAVTAGVSDALLEFVPGDDPALVPREAETLNGWIRQARKDLS